MKEEFKIKRMDLISGIVLLGLVDVEVLFLDLSAKLVNKLYLAHLYLGIRH